MVGRTGDTAGIGVAALVAAGWLALAPACSGGGDGAPDGGTADAAADLPADPAADAPPPALPTADEVLRPGPYGVGALTLDLEDTSRATPESDTFEGGPTRILPTAVWYPVVPAPAEGVAPPPGGPWPLVAYAHGFFSFNSENADLASLLASRGFVVAAPLFPLTNIGTPGGPNSADVVNQPADLSFVIDAVLAAGADPASPLFGAADATRVGAMGVSLGGLTAVLAAFHPQLRDPRVRAAVAAATPGCYLPDGFFEVPDLPLLALHGTRDRIVPFAANGPPFYAAARAPKTFVALTGATHAGMAGLARAVLKSGNSDQVGCDALADNPSITPEALAALSQDFGGKPHDLALAQCPGICLADDGPDAPMDVERQLRLLTLAATAFLESTLAGDASMARYLREGLAREGDDLSVEQVP